MLTTGIKWIAVTIAAVAIGEAVALSFGTLPRRGERNPWATGMHRLDLALDIVSGSAIIWLALTAPGGRASAAMWGWLIVFVASHALRLVEYLGHTPNAFCANRQLFVVNGIKLVGMLVVMVGIIWA